MGGVPAGATAVTGNLTVTGQSSLGYLYVGPNATNNPTSSTLNFPLKDDRANGVTVALSGTGTLSATYIPATSPANAHVIFDVTGYFTPDSSGATYVPLTPSRILDTRSDTGLSGVFSSHAARTFGVTGHGGVPTNATAVTGNLTVTAQTSGGYLYIGPNATNNPTSSTLNFPVKDDRANGVTVALGTGGTLSVTYVGATSPATAHVIFDVTGYFTADTSGARYVPLTPSRILDTRYGTGLSGVFSSHGARTFGVTGHGGVPNNTTAVTGNLTVTAQTSPGYLYIGPNATNNPTSSTLNFPVADDRANGVTVALGGGGTLSVTFVAPTSGPTTHVIFDVTGYFETSSPTLATWTLDIYDQRAERWQDPDLTACTAASTESMLNTVFYSGSDSGFVWQPTTSYSTQESILAFERDNMTMLASSAGSDPHGWRNALNFYGWASVNAAVYRDSSYSSFDVAARSVVSALARHHKPVGILSRSGRHSVFITGYQVTGDDPSTGSEGFSIVGVDLTDPYQAAGHRDTWVTLSDWRSGDSWIQFSPYLETDSPYQDPIDGQVGTSEWYGKWVIIDPVK